MRNSLQSSSISARTVTTVKPTTKNGNFLRHKIHRAFPMPPRPLPRRIVCSQNRPVNAVLGTTITTIPQSRDRLGIVSFLEGKNYFITGATGFLAKAFVEKMLRTVPDTGKIFLLIRAKDEEAAKERLKKEIIDTDLFERLRQTYGKSFESFVMSKLVPVVGNIGENNLGMDPDTAKEIAGQIDVIVSSAASTTFDERYDVALNINTLGPHRLLSFAKKCKKMCLFLHFSTAYVNGGREGVSKEIPFYMGQSIAAEKMGWGKSSVPLLDIGTEMGLAETSSHREAAQKMKELGLERAEIYGWHDTYSFTKAMGEMMINSLKGDFPIAIVRPSIIQSSFREPYPGWIEGNRMLDPLILSYGKGRLPCFFGDPQAVVDIVPVDMVVNAAMAAMAKNGLADKPELKVYHVGSSVVNPLLLHDVFSHSFNHFSSSPIKYGNGKEISIDEMQFFGSLDDFSTYIKMELTGKEDTAAAAVSDPNARMKRAKMANYLIEMAKIYKAYAFYGGWFDSTNTQQLLEEMSAEERQMFEFDVSRVNWKHFISNVHIPGLKRHVMKGRSAI